MKKTTVRIGENEYLFTGDISIIVGVKCVRVITFDKDNNSVNHDFEKSEFESVVINNWKKD